MLVNLIGVFHDYCVLSTKGPSALSGILSGSQKVRRRVFEIIAIEEINFHIEQLHLRT